MKLATIRVNGTTRAVKAVHTGAGDVLVDLGAADLGEFLAAPDWRERAPRPRHHADGRRRDHAA